MKVITDSGEIELGAVEATPTIGITDYSRRVTDDFGVTTVVKRDFSRRMSVRMVMPQDDVDAVQRRLAGLRATEAQWIADPRFDWLSVTGFFRDFELDIPGRPLSYCRLEVEGLAESEPGIDDGADPSPQGMQSTLRLLEPVAIDDGALVSSSVPEDDYTPWSEVTNYVAGARVRAGHRIYESAVADNLGHDPADSDGHWIDIGPTNRFAMFDEALGTLTTASGSITVTLNVENVDAVALLDVTAATVRVQAAGYDTTQAAGENAITFLDLAGLTGSVTVTIAGAGEVAVGTLLVGSLKALGLTRTSPTAGIMDYSRKETDDFGQPVIVERAWAKRMAIDAVIRADALDTVANRIARVRARPCLWIGDDDLDSLTVYGFFNDFSIEVGPTISNLSLSIEGLSKAPVIPDRTPTAPDPDAWSLAQGATADGIPALIVAGVCDFPGTDSVLIEYRGTGGDWIARGKFDALTPVHHVIAPVDGAADYEARIAYQSGTRVGPWLVLSEVTTPAFEVGLNSATVVLYKRAATAPAVPGATTYTFETGALTGDLAGWAQSAPAHTGDPLWTTRAFASSHEPTVAIPGSGWATPQILAMDGTPGSPGTPGLPATALTLTRRSISLWAYADGNVVSFDNADGQIDLVAGSTSVLADADLAISGTNATGQINTAANTPVAGKPKGYYRVTGLTGDNGYLTITATYGGRTFSEAVSVSKITTGYEVVSALPTSNLYIGRPVFLTTDEKLYRYTSTGWTASTAASDLEGTLTLTQLGVVPTGLNPDPNYRDPGFWALSDPEWHLEEGTDFAGGRWFGMWEGWYTGSDPKFLRSQFIDSPPPGEVIRLSTAISNYSNRPIDVWVDFFTPTGTFLGNGGSYVSSPPGSQVQTFSTQLTVPAGAGLLRIQARNVEGVAYSGAVRIGPIRLDIATRADLVVNGAVRTEHLYSGAVTTDKLSAGAVTAAKANITQLSALTAIIGTLRTATSGGRLEISDNVLKVFDPSNVKRLQLGNLSL